MGDPCSVIHEARFSFIIKVLMFLMKYNQHAGSLRRGAQV